MQRIWLLCSMPILLCSASKGWALSEDLFELSLQDLLDIEIVSASKSADTLKDIPNTVTIITREDIAVMGYGSLEELLIYLPSVYHIDNYEDFLIGVRGIVGGSIAFLVNGVLQHPTRIKGLTIPDRSRTNIPIDSIDRIEFVRGPSSVIYGNNAFMGSINIITNNIEIASGKATAASGSNGYGRAFLRMGKKFEEGSLVANLGVYQTNGIGGNIDAMMTQEQLDSLATQYPGYRKNLDGTLDHENYNLDVSGFYHRLNYGFRYSKMKYGFYPLAPPNQDGAELTLSSWLVNASYDQPFSENVSATFQAIVSQEDYDLHPDYWPNAHEGYQHQAATRYELESIVKYDNNVLRGVLGFNYQLLDDIASEVDIQATAEGARYERERSSTSLNTFGVFANARLSLTSALSVVGGYRTSKTSDYELSSYGTGLDPEGLVQPVESMDEDALKLALLYDFTSRQSVKFSYSTATQNNRSTTLFEPEQLESWELNYSYTSANFNLSGSAFVNSTERIHRLYQEFDDAQFGKSEDNSGEWYTEGLEIIATLRPSKRFTLEFSSVIQETTDKAVSEEIIIGNSPELVAKLKLGYGFTNWKLAGALAYTDEILADYRVHQLNGSVARYGDGVPAYCTLGGNLRYQQPGNSWYLNIHGFNLTNEDIYYPANELVNFYHGTYGPSRQISFTVGVDF